MSRVCRSRYIAVEANQIREDFDKNVGIGTSRVVEDIMLEHFQVLVLVYIRCKFSATMNLTI